MRCALIKALATLKRLRNIIKKPKSIKKKNTEDYKAYLDLALEIDSDFIKVHYLLGQLYIKKDNKENLNITLKRLLISVQNTKHIYFDLAEIAFSEAKTKGNEGQYKRCVECLDEYMKRIEEKHYNFKKAFERYLLCSEFNDIYNYPVPYNPIPLKGISSSADEYLPILSPDNEIMLFTMRFKEEPKGKVLIKRFDLSKNFIKQKKLTQVLWRYELCPNHSTKAKILVEQLWISAILKLSSQYAMILIMKVAETVTYIIQKEMAVSGRSLKT